MRSRKLGRSISQVEVTNISAHGFWLYVNGKEYFLPFEEYPWFREAKVGDIVQVELHHNSHLYWPRLDVDLDIAMLESRQRYPLVYR
jgi:hypothetical protein